MKRGKRMFGMLTVFIFLSISGLSAVHAGDVIELKAASFYPTKHPVAQEVFIPWGKLIEKRTDGRVKFTWYLDRTLVKAEQTLKAVKGGMVDIVAPLAIWAFEKQFPATVAVFMPFQLDSESQAAQSFYEAFHKIAAVQNEYKGMKVLGFQSTGMGNFSMKETLIKDLADFKGKVIWPGNRVTVAALKIWGASPRLVKMADIYMSLQRGTLDGIMFPTPPLSDFRFTDIVNKHTICDYSLGAQAVCMNQAKWNSLPPDIQKIFEELTLPLSIAIGKKFEEMNVQILSKLKKRGDSIYFLPEDKRAVWRSSLQPIFDNQTETLNKAGLDGKAIMKEAQSIVKEARKNPYKLNEKWLSCDK